MVWNYYSILHSVVLGDSMVDWTPRISDRDLSKGRLMGLQGSLALGLGFRGDKSSGLENEVVFFKIYPRSPNPQVTSFREAPSPKPCTAL